MVFSSTVFLFLFLPITVIAYYLVRKDYRNYLLLLASIVFYSWGEPKHILLLLILTIINYCIGRLFAKVKRQYAKIILIAGIVVNVGSLVYYKYSAFFVGFIGSLFGIDMRDSFVVYKGAMPIGISFFVFQILSYVIDVYRGDVPPQKDITKLGLYIMLFPQMIAGPIVRYSDVMDQIECRDISFDKTHTGIKRFILGFSKKILIANSAAKIADYAFSYQQSSMALAWFGAIAYMIQIYFDFSGYSDMAIGLGKIFGFDFIENFNFPYLSRSIKEFWRRWHISLSSWFKDYLYIPLGGNRKGKIRTYINLVIVFAVTGLWHGASVSFLCWGLYYAVFLIIERVGFGEVLDRMPRFVSRVYSLLVILIGWVLFRADTLSAAVAYIATMFNFRSFDFASVFGIANVELVFWWVTGIVLVSPLYHRFRPWLKKKCGNSIIGDCVSLCIFTISELYMIGSDFNPFIYFRF